ncbi:tetratricopeptide repeat protein [Rivularia sp. PCC 7116]|uniref:tetratricopeptide repeat protein n=1 Tax=Rivularia sp. PCC 7116 TaxID=373994 RepID=UPI00029F2EFF|nr:tetratricopeptide repeat protein [Rivularia sp. PCC 7116]AFY55338.1 tetratricopeptide repeat protein [Rivularia sp. PCC 7116]
MNYKKLISLTLTIATLTTINTIIPQIKTQANQPQNKPTTTQTKASDWYYQGIIKANQKDYQGAINDFTKAIQMNPQYAAAYHQRGLIYANYARGKILRSDGTLPGCVRVDDYSVSCEVKVTANWKQQNQQQAIKDFNRVIKISPRYAAAYRQRGLIQENRGDKLKDVQVAADIYHSQALRYLDRENYLQAARLLEKVDKLYLEMNPEAGIIERPTGSPGALSDYKKSPYQLMREGTQALDKADLQTALRKYRLAARKLKYGTKKDRRKYRDLQGIIGKLEGKKR